MASFLTRCFLLSLLFLIIFFFQLSSQQPLCREDEHRALVQFKDSFVIDRRASPNPSAYIKVNLWRSQGIDCCSWEGIRCDQQTGHVTRLDLSNSCLFGSINSSNSLFNLKHLRYLNLAFNDFNYSEIPSALGNLSGLTYLDLSNSSFYGQVPFEISKLSKLTTLDLSFNLGYSYEGLLELKKPDLNTLIQNLTRLQVIRLSFVNINSLMPNVLANLSSLSCLRLSQCGLFGKFPTAIFQLPKLEYLILDGNLGLTGSLPEFHFSSPLKVLYIANTSFFGEFPASFGLLSSLEHLDARNCNISGFLPSSLSNLTELSCLTVRNNSLKGSMASFSNLTQLSYVDLSLNQFTFSAVSSFASSTHIYFLNLAFNHISGEFPSWLGNLTKLTFLSLHENMLEGSIPSSISRLENLVTFSIDRNNFKGTVEFDMFLGLKNLKHLHLSQNNFSLIIKSVTNGTVQKFSTLGLGSCNLREFPGFLQHQDELIVLDLSFNDIHGPIPKWLLTVSASLWYLSLSTDLFFLDLSHNLLEGSLPITPPFMGFYMVSGNKFSGEIPSQFCYMTSLQVLDLSQNNLRGMVPQCLSNLSSMLILNLEANNFHGTIPETWETGNRIKEIKLGQNNLQGGLPTSLANCTMLEFFDVGNNQIRDNFPSWLVALPELRILILRSNKFYGVIGGPGSGFLFPKLRIIDLSDNGFGGPLPTNYFESLKGIADLDLLNSTYLTGLDGVVVHGFLFHDVFPYSLTITNKGQKLNYEKVLEIFTAIDLSCNKFVGGIPELLGNLQGLQLLNLSNNFLVGPIPQALGDLTNIEAMDLSQNKLTGRVPAQLTQLNFLAVFNVSHNHLTGPIPEGQQFDTFESSSFDGNPGLCGFPLSNRCDHSKSKDLPPSSTSVEDEDNGLLAAFGWKAVLLGFGCGVLVGTVIGNIVFTRRQEWFLKTFRIRQPRRQRREPLTLNRMVQ